MNAEIRAGLSLAREYQPAMAAASGATAGFGAAHAAAAAQVAAAGAAIRDVTGSAGDMTAKFEAARASIGVMAADALRANEQMAAGFDRVRIASASGADQIRAFSAEVGGLRSSASDTAAAVDKASRSIDVLMAKASGAGNASISALGPALAAAMGAGSGGGGGTTDPAIAAVVARNLASRGYGPTPGSTSAVDAALAGLMGAAGGGEAEAAAEEAGAAAEAEGAAALRRLRPSGTWPGGSGTSTRSSTGR